MYLIWIRDTPIHQNIIFDFNNFILFYALMHIHYARYYII